MEIPSIKAKSSAWGSVRKPVKQALSHRSVSVKPATSDSCVVEGRKETNSQPNSGFSHRSISVKPVSFKSHVAEGKKEEKASLPALSACYSV